MAQDEKLALKISDLQKKNSFVYFSTLPRFVIFSIIRLPRTLQKDKQCIEWKSIIAGYSITSISLKEEK